MTTTHLPPEPLRPPHPSALMILYLPFGAAGGYFIVTLGFILPKMGVSVADVAALAALVVFPNTWKVLWAPLVDTTLTAKKWYAIAAVSTAIVLLAAAFVPVKADWLWVLRIFALVSSITSSVCAMAAERLMAYTTPEHLRGRAGGWSQAGNLGGQAFGGGLGLWLADNFAGWTAGAALAIGTLLCCLALIPYSEEARAEGRLNYLQAIADLGKDIWVIAASRVGFLTLLLLFLPIGSGGASNLWSAISGDWHATAETVELVNGLLNGIVSVIGCLVGGYLCDIVDRKTGYAIFGILLAVCAVAMALAPRTVDMFVIFTLAYAFILGLAYAAFCAVTLETIGKGAAATKYNLLACLSNVPIWYMTSFDGWVHDACPGDPLSSVGVASPAAVLTSIKQLCTVGATGTHTMLYAEAAACVLAVIIFGLVALVTWRPQRATSPLAETS